MKPRTCSRRSSTISGILAFEHARKGFNPEERRVNIVWFLLIGLVAGWLAGRLVKGRGSGLVENLVIGVIGALNGGFVFGQFGVSSGGNAGRAAQRNGRCRHSPVSLEAHPQGLETDAIVENCAHRLETMLSVCGRESGHVSPFDRCRPRAASGS
jgi:uncharacterized membrane protein YeaQ/YmgE (transglycosylase-associated protein family)